MPVELGGPSYTSMVALGASPIMSSISKVSSTDPPVPVGAPLPTGIVFTVAEVP